jgi:hypothetical protein
LQTPGMGIQREAVAVGGTERHSGTFSRHDLGTTPRTCALRVRGSRTLAPASVGSPAEIGWHLSEADVKFS